MPESENVEVARRGFEAFLRGGFDAALETVSPNLVSGVEVEGRFWFLCTVEDGKVGRLDGFASREQAVEAARRA